MKFTILYFDRGVIGGWEAAIKVGEKRHMVPAKFASGGTCNFNSKAEARRHAIRFANELARKAQK